MAMIIAYFLGIFLRIFITCILIHFLIKKIRKSDSVLQRFIIVSLATIGYIWSIPFPIDSINVLLSKLIWVVIAWNIIIGIFTFRLKLKFLFLSLFYSIILIFPLAFIPIFSFAILGITNKYDVVIGKIAFYISFAISPILVYRQKLPFTKRLIRKNE